MTNFTDCDGDGCGECDVCKYLSYHEWVDSVAPAGSSRERNPELDKYIKEKYSKETSNDN